MSRRGNPIWLVVTAVPLSMLLGALLCFIAVRYLDTKRPLASRTSTSSADPLVAPDAKPASIAARGDLSAAEQTTIKIFEQASPSVVFITNVAIKRDLFRRRVSETPAGTGSGFLWSEKGHVVTNFHVIQGANKLRVTLSDQSVWPAKVVGIYPAKDVAVLKIDAPADRMLPLQVGASNDLVVGQHVFAIGNPFGLDHTLSTGVISGLEREIMSIAQRPIQGVIQTDAAINPGNSGGPLLDSAGRLIGINTAIYSPSGASAGVGFAVPVDTVHDVVTQIIRTGRVIRPALGIRIDEGSIARRLGIKGVVVLGVDPKSGAGKAGVQGPTPDGNGGATLGDVVVSIDGAATKTHLELYRQLDRKKVGDTVKVGLRRGGRTLEVDIALTSVAE